MTWNLSAECISCVFVCIILIYSFRSTPLPNLKNRVFQGCLVTTFGSIVFNILSTLMLHHFLSMPRMLTILVTTIYFIFTPLMGLTYFAYSISYLFEEDARLARMILMSAVPYGAYLLLVLSNFWTRWIFAVDPVLGYVRGPAINATYAIFYIYCLACVVLVLFKRRAVETVIMRTLMIFPLIAMVVVVMQLLFPTYILTGSAAACALLIIYLYLQNKRISYDYLTEVMTRQECLKMLELKHKKRAPFTVIILSINHFKFLNDKLGPHNGDLLLKQISRFLKEAAGIQWIYRYSGDQFVLLLEKGQRSRTQELVDKISHRLQASWGLGDYSYSISASIGVVDYPSTADTLEDVLGGLEITVAKAKGTADNSVCVCNHEMLAEVNRKKVITEILKKHLEQNSFTIYYQPIWSTTQQRFILAEALMRLHDPELGNISPGEFIPIAEDTGLIIDMTYQLLDKVCGFLSRLLQAGGDIEGISVNFSVIQFMQSDLLDRVREIIARNGVPFSKIKIEITESVLMSNIAVVKSYIDAMCREDIRFGLDDFGTGYSNIATVLQVPFNTVKLDKSLIDLSMDQPESANFLKYIIHAFSEMGKRVLSEGIETVRQRDFVTSCGCDCIQGFLYARPMPEEEAMQVLLQKNLAK